MKCAYCGTEYDGNKCPSCGAKLKAENKEVYKSQPFFMGGFMVVLERSDCSDYTKYHFYKGEHYCGTITIANNILRHRAEKYGFTSDIEFFRKLMKAQLGDIVDEWQDEREIHFTTTLTQIDVGEQKYNSFMEALEAQIDA